MPLNPTVRQLPTEVPLTANQRAGGQHELSGRCGTLGRLGPRPARPHSGTEHQRGKSRSGRSASLSPTGVEGWDMAMGVPKDFLQEAKPLKAKGES